MLGRRYEESNDEARMINRIAEKRAARIIQRTVRHWLQNFH
jgi:hypothetical protein